MGLSGPVRLLVALIKQNRLIRIGHGHLGAVLFIINAQGENIDGHDGWKKFFDGRLFFRDGEVAENIAFHNHCETGIVGGRRAAEHVTPPGNKTDDFHFTKAPFPE